MADIYGGSDPRMVKIRKDLRSGKVKKKSTAHRLRKEYYKLKRGQNGDPTGPRSIRDLQREADSAANLRYGDTEREIQGEQRASDAMHPRIDNWFDQWLGQVQSARDATAASFKSAQDQLAQAQQRTSDTGATERQRIQQEAQADAAKRGGQVDAGLFAKAAQAAESGRQSGDAFRGLMGTLGANQTSFLDTRKSIGAGEKTAQHVLETRRRKAIDKRLQDLLKDKGEYRVQKIGEGRDTERKYKLERAAFGLDQQKVSQDAQKDSIDLALKERGLDIQQQNADANTLRANQGPKAKPKFTGTKVRANKDKFDSGRALISPLIKKGKIKAGKGDKGIQFLVSEGYPALLAKAIVMDALYGGVDARTRRRVKQRYGFTPHLSPSERRKKRG